LMLVLLMFLTGCTTAQQGAKSGGLGGDLGLPLEKGDRSTTDIAGGIVAAAGICWETKLTNRSNLKSMLPDKQRPPEQIAGKSLPAKPSMEMIETIKEVCEGKKSTADYLT